MSALKTTIISGLPVGSRVSMRQVENQLEDHPPTHKGKRLPSFFASVFASLSPPSLFSLCDSNAFSPWYHHPIFTPFLSKMLKRKMANVIEKLVCFAWIYSWNVKEEFNLGSTEITFLGFLLALLTHVIDSLRYFINFYLISGFSSRVSPVEAGSALCVSISPAPVTVPSAWEALGLWGQEVFSDMRQSLIHPFHLRMKDVGPAVDLQLCTQQSSHPCGATF